MLSLQIILSLNFIQQDKSSLENNFTLRQKTLLKKSYSEIQKTAGHIIILEEHITLSLIQNLRNIILFLLSKYDLHSRQKMLMKHAHLLHRKNTKKHYGLLNERQLLLL